MDLLVRSHLGLLLPDIVTSLDLRHQAHLVEVASHAYSFVQEWSLTVGLLLIGVSASLILKLNSLVGGLLLIDLGTTN